MIHENYQCMKKYSPNEKKEIFKAFEKLQVAQELETAKEGE